MTGPLCTFKQKSPTMADIVLSSLIKLLKPSILKCSLVFNKYIGFYHNSEKINILNASILAMNTAIENLKIVPEFIIVDGNKFNTKNKIPFKCIIKGDTKYMSIAAASILAKTSRDEFMFSLSKKFPLYQWNKNKGYPTKKHRIAISKYGITKHHRKKFKLL